MKKYLALSLLSLSCSLGTMAQEKDLYTFTMEEMPAGIDVLGLVPYYYAGDRMYNIRRAKLSQTGPILDMKLNPSGSSYALMRYDNEKGRKTIVDIYNLNAADAKLAEVKRLTSTPTAICYTANARQLLVAVADGHLYSYDALKARPIDTLNINTMATRLVMSGNGLMLAAVHDNVVDMWNWRSKSLRKSIQCDANVRQVCFTADCEQMAILTEDKKLGVYKTSDFTLQNTIDDLGEAIDCSFHPDGKYVAVITENNRIAIANVLNVKKREYIDAPDAGVGFVRFANSYTDPSLFLTYNMYQQLLVRKMDYLTPRYSKLISGRLQERMDEWVRQREGETLEEYNLRVNDASREAHIKMLESDISTELAMDEIGRLELGAMGAYNTESHLLSIGLNNKMPDIYLNVPEEELGAFMNKENLQLRNVKYGLNSEDEFVMLYAEVYNTELQKTYVYNNSNGEYLDFVSDELTITPFELLQKSKLEETTLTELTETVVNEAKENNLITDHTHISVKTNVRNATDDNGNRIHNYEVGVTYEVEQEFSARDDYAAGKYKIEESNAGMAMLKIVQQALGDEFAKYMVAGKRLNIKVTGAADAMPITGRIKYDGCYGNYEMEPISRQGNMSNITVTKASGITDNDQLAFLRAVGVKDYLFRNVAQLKDMITDVNYDILVSDQEGSQFRKVSLLFTFEDAFEQ